MSGLEALTDPGTALPIIGLLLVSGAAIGILAGLFGVGGGAISVPVFYETFLRLDMVPDIAMPMAVGTSLAMIVPTSIKSAQSHAAKGTVDTALLKTWALPILFGVALGSVLARYSSAAVFQSVFVLVAGTIAVKLLFAKDTWKIRDEMPGPAGIGLYGLAIGLLASLMGVGGGAISNLIMTLNGRSVLQAISTSAGVGVLIAVPGSIGYILAGWGKVGLPFDAIGFVSMLTLLMTVPTALMTTRIGVRMAHALSARTLSRLLGLFFLLVCARFLGELV